jgi:hypothetical protein
MPSRRAIAGVLHNFLGSFASRNSDLGGYWMFGLVVTTCSQTSIDLLGDGDAGGAPPHEVASRRLARATFERQMMHARAPRSALREARLEISRSAAPRIDAVDGHDRQGHDLTLRVSVTTAHGQTIERQTTIFVAPHDPALERRSTRSNDDAVRSTP